MQKVNPIIFAPASARNDGVNSLSAQQKRKARHRDGPLLYFNFHFASFLSDPRGNQFSARSSENRQLARSTQRLRVECVALFDCSLRSSQAGSQQTIRRTGDVVQADLMAELH